MAHFHDLPEWWDDSCPVTEPKPVEVIEVIAEVQSMLDFINACRAFRRTRVRIERVVLLNDFTPAW